MDTNQKPQVEITLDVYAPASKIWDLINNSEGLPIWNSSMKNVKIISHEKSTLNEVRECQVQFGKKLGMVTERCIEHIPNKKLARAIIKENLGMSKMIKDSWFSEELKELSPDKTKYTFKMYYKPANFLVSIMNFLMMRGKMTKDTMAIINKMKETAEKNNSYGIQ